MGCYVLVCYMSIIGNVSIRLNMAMFHIYLQSIIFFVVKTFKALLAHYSCSYFTCSNTLKLLAMCKYNSPSVDSPFPIPPPLTFCSLW